MITKLLTHLEIWWGSHLQVSVHQFNYIFSWGIIAINSISDTYIIIIANTVTIVSIYKHLYNTLLMILYRIAGKFGGQNI